MRLIVLLIATLLLSLGLHAQRQQMAAITYNVENLFRPGSMPDSTLDPDSPTLHPRQRYARKLLMLAKTVIGATGFSKLALLGLCEVGGQKEVEDLINETPLSILPLSIIHKESPDVRGIDVALVYNQECMRLLSTRFIHVAPLTPTSRPTRDMLLASFLTPAGDTLSVVQCHWPSNYGGTSTSLPLRRKARNILRSTLDSIRATHPQAKILVMGDMNSLATDSIFYPIARDNLKEAQDSCLLVNLMHPNFQPAKTQSYRYRGGWYSIDLMFASPALLTRQGTTIRNSQPQAYTASFMLEEDAKWGGQKPRRSLGNQVFHQGWSDHLPIVLQLESHSR